MAFNLIFIRNHKMEKQLKRIVVIVREFETYGHRSKTDVDSRMYDGDNGNPLMEKDGYHLGQVSSSFTWAFQDISTRYDKDLKSVYEKEYEYKFEFYYVTLEFIKKESKAWWESLIEEAQIWCMAKIGYENRHPKFARPQCIEEMWVSQRMKEVAEIKIQKIIDLYEIV